MNKFDKCVTKLVRPWTKTSEIQNIEKLNILRFWNYFFDKQKCCREKYSHLVIVIVTSSTKIKRIVLTTKDRCMITDHFTTISCRCVLDEYKNRRLYIRLYVWICVYMYVWLSRFPRDLIWQYINRDTSCGKYFLGKTINVFIGRKLTWNGLARQQKT